MTARVLHIHAPGARVIPLPARTTGGIGDGAISAGLTRMARNAGAELGLPAGDLDVIEVGLQPNASSEERRCALKRLAEHHADWSATVEGITELLRLWTFLAPHTPYTVLEEIAQELAFADDQQYPRGCRDIARDNADVLLDRACDKPARIVRPPSWHRTDPGPGAA